METKKEFMAHARDYFGYIDGGIELLGNVWDKFAVKIWEDTDIIVKGKYPNASAPTCRSIRETIYSFYLSEIALAVADGKIELKK